MNCDFLMKDGSCSHEQMKGQSGSMRFCKFIRRGEKCPEGHIKSNTTARSGSKRKELERRKARQLNRRKDKVYRRKTRDRPKIHTSNPKETRDIVNMNEDTQNHSKESRSITKGKGVAKKRPVVRKDR